MILARYFAKPLILFLLIFAVTLFQQQSARAMGIDLLGEVSEPILGPAKEKMKKMIVYIWLQPYAGYAFGSSELTRTTAGGVVTPLNDVSTSGFLYGGRGGIFLYRTLRLGVDYSIQSIQRNTLKESTTPGIYVQQSGNGKNTMFGATFGFDVPYTPLQGYITRYFNAILTNDDAGSGDGWGAGVSFVLKNPFILSLEKRKATYSATDISGKKASTTIDQYYVALSFMLL